MRLPEGFVNEIMGDLRSMSGMVIWRVTGTWASLGRNGDIEAVVVAANAIDAIRIAWAPEDPRDLRTISAQWLGPVEHIKSAKG